MGRWYVYLDDQLRPWSVRLPAWIGEHPDLGFRPVEGRAPEPAPTNLRLRRIALLDEASGRTWSVPVGQPSAAVLRRPGGTVLMPHRGGRRHLARGEVQPEAYESRARASLRARAAAPGDRRPVTVQVLGAPSPTTG